MDGPGRPSHYKPEFAEQAFELCLAGATNRDLAETFEVGHSTIDNWLHKHPEFAQAVRRGRAPGRRQGGARPLCPRHRLQLRDHPGRALQGRAGGRAADGAQAARRQGRHLLAAQPPARAVARLRAGAPRGASGAEQARGPSPGQDLAQPHRGLGADREGDAWPVARQAVPDDGGGARGGHQEGHGEGRVGGHAAHHEARADDADADAVLLQHVADALAPDADGGLAGIVGRRVGQADEARERGDDGDLAALAGDQPRRSAARRC